MWRAYKQFKLKFEFIVKCVRKYEFIVKCVRMFKKIFLPKNSTQFIFWQ